MNDDDQRNLTSYTSLVWSLFYDCIHFPRYINLLGAILVFVMNLHERNLHNYQECYNITFSILRL